MWELLSKLIFPIVTFTAGFIAGWMERKTEEDIKNEDIRQLRDENRILRSKIS